MTTDLLPRDEPGRPLLPVSPDFNQKVMARINAIRAQRRESRTRMLLLIGGLVAVVGVFATTRMPANDPLPVQITPPTAHTTRPAVSNPPAPVQAPPPKPHVVLRAATVRPPSTTPPSAMTVYITVTPAGTVQNAGGETAAVHDPRCGTCPMPAPRCGPENQLIQRTTTRAPLGTLYVDPCQASTPRAVPGRRPKRVGAKGEEF
jgi:hypothetical protein